ncbi:MAG: DUF177 domain-containing protein [Bacteroidales bacterium]
MKGYWNQFVIPFKGMKEGKHNFVFDINKTFFEGFEHSLLEEGQVTVHMELDRQKHMLVFRFEIKGSINLACDRCLERYNQHIEGRQVFIAKFSDFDQSDSDNEEVTILPEDAHEYDVSHQIYEYINLLLPIKHVHEHQSECKQEMINKIEEENNPNNEEKVVDERWKALEELKKKMKNN